MVTESYRLDGHYSGEPEVYRSKDEVNSYWEKEPIKRFKNFLILNNKVSEDEILFIEKEIIDEIHDAVQFAKDSPEPDYETALDYIYA